MQPGKTLWITLEGQDAFSVKVLAVDGDWLKGEDNNRTVIHISRHAVVRLFVTDEK